MNTYAPYVDRKIYQLNSPAVLEAWQEIKHGPRSEQAWFLFVVNRCLGDMLKEVSRNES
jgi:hypothetical protein